MLAELAAAPGSMQPQAILPALPSAALSSLESSTRSLLRPGDSAAICVRRDLVPGQILVGLIVSGIYVAVTIDAAEDTSLKLLNVVGRFLFAETSLPRPSAHAAALEALAAQPTRPSPRSRVRN